MSLRDTRETVDAEVKYMYFDQVIDEYQRGECTFEEAIEAYHHYIGHLAVAGSAD